jgi:hypothetical protein
MPEIMRTPHLLNIIYPLPPIKPRITSAAGMDMETYSIRHTKRDDAKCEELWHMKCGAFWAVLGMYLGVEIG